jgi:tRNA(His) 5'-end guanylyltransferase
MSIGRIDINIIPSTTFSKLFFTRGICPKKYPASVRGTIHKNAHMILYAMNDLYGISLTPATKGAIVLTIGTKRAITILFFPCFSKNFLVFSI